MKRKEQLSVVLFVVMLLVVHHYFFYPPVTEERRTADALYDINRLVASGDFDRIQEGVMRYLAEDGRIRLEISYETTDQDSEESKPAVTYEFSKTLFKAYLFNLLRSLDKVAFAGYLSEFAISPDWKEARSVIESRGSADGASRFMTKLRNVRFYYDAVCTVQLSLAASRPVAKEIDCRMLMRKPEALTQ
jgi:hypothetical protein